MAARTYFRILTAGMIAVFVFRSWLGSRGNFTGDDFDFRELVNEGLSWPMLFDAHNGHMNPVGLFVQWVVQGIFPGRYVPLMVFSALLVASAGWLIGLWAERVFGPRWQGLFAAVVLTTSLTQLESATWWSVALYAAPLLAASALFILLGTEYLLGRARLWVAVAGYALCLLSSTKGILLPLLLLGIAAGLPLRRERPLGFRAALIGYRRLWGSLAVTLAAYSAVYLLRQESVATGDSGVTVLSGFVRNLYAVTFLPSVWGGPWQWMTLDGHGAPAPAPWLKTLALLLSVAAVVALLSVRPRVWRMLLACGLYILASATLVGIGRAGGSLTGPVLRYTFDFGLPVVLVLITGLAATRWETDPYSSIGTRFRAWMRDRPRLGRAVPWLVTSLWLGSVAISYITPWHLLPESSIRPWSATVRQYYPLLSDGLLEQPAPAKRVFLPTPLNRLLVGDRAAPPERQVVLDRLLGFDDDGFIVDNRVAGVPAVPPTTDCAYRATSDSPARVPLEAPVPQARHTVAIDYLLSITTPADISLGAEPQPATLPSGARRVFAVVEGSGSELTVTVGNPQASLCVLSATVGWVEQGPRVDPEALR